MPGASAGGHLACEAWGLVASRSVVVGSGSSRAGLGVLARSGHTLNIKELDVLNVLVGDFFGRVAAEPRGPGDPNTPAFDDELWIPKAVKSRRGPGDSDTPAPCPGSSPASRSPLRLGVGVAG